MKIIDRVIKLIESNHKKDFNCIPFLEIFPRFSGIVPGIKKQSYVAITGTPSSAKTQFTDFTYLYYPFDFCKSNNIDFEIIYFSFELSKEVKILQGISNKLFDQYGIRFSPNALQKIGNEWLKEEDIEKVKKVRDYFADLENYVTFYDEPMTPSQMYEVMLSKMKENGTYDDKNKIYKPIDPNKYIIFIVDHISLIRPDYGQTPHQALVAYSSNNIFLRNNFGATIVNVHQQGAEGGVEQFTSSGANITSKLEPKLAGLADNRTLGRDYDLILGLFSPFKHEIDIYRGYKTKRLMDKCRFLSVVKNREGLSDVQVGLYFDGAISYFEELPKADEFYVLKNGIKNDNEELYDKYVKGLVGPLSPNKQKIFTFQ